MPIAEYRENARLDVDTTWESEVHWFLCCEFLPAPSEHGMFMPPEDRCAHFIPSHYIIYIYICVFF